MNQRKRLIVVLMCVTALVSLLLLIHIGAYEAIAANVFGAILAWLLANTHGK